MARWTVVLRVTYDETFDVEAGTEEEAYTEAESFDYQPVDREAQSLAVRRDAVEQGTYQRGGVA
jgi:hypothetical protein